MRGTLFTVALAALVGIGQAYAQEGGGAGRIEISAFPGGGVFFRSSSSETEPDFGNYTVGGAFTYNFNRWIGAEGGGDVPALVEAVGPARRGVGSFSVNYWLNQLRLLHTT